MELSQSAPTGPCFKMKWWKWVTQMIIAWWFSLPWAHWLLCVFCDQSEAWMGISAAPHVRSSISRSLGSLVCCRGIFHYSHIISALDVTTRFYLMWEEAASTVLGSKRHCLFCDAHRDSCFAAMMCVFHSRADSSCQLLWVMAPEAFIHHKPALH